MSTTEECSKRAYQHYLSIFFFFLVYNDFYHNITLEYFSVNLNDEKNILQRSHVVLFCITTHYFEHITFLFLFTIQYLFPLTNTCTSNYFDVLLILLYGCIYNITLLYLIITSNYH